MTRNVLQMVTLLTLVTLSGHALAETPHVFKHDQFSDSISAASQELSGITLGTQPGFVAGEAFGVVFKPDANMYPVKIQGVDVVMAAMPYDIPNSQAHAVIEVYFLDGPGPDPASAPVFTLSTHDVFNEQIMDLGAPLQGNTAMSFEFDWAEPAGHPPLLTSGNFLVAVRFTEACAADLTAEWGTFQCTFQPILGFCGCQDVGTLHDQASTANANVVHIIYPPGNCDGAANKWVWFGDIGITGDVILRVRASVADAPCTPSCLNKECGADGCDGSCGECTGAGETCVAGLCEVCEADCADKDCGDDGCGGSCGECAAGACVQGVCEGPCEPVCEGKACGADQCGGSCGDCTGGKTCSASGQCIEEGVCDPVANCLGKECGTDGCGGVCGVCSAGKDCVQGACSGGVVEGGEFSILSVSPEEGCNDEDTQITIIGSGFVDGMTAIMGAQPIVVVKLDTTMLRATVPADMKTGTYDLIVTSPDETSKFFPGAFKVTRCGDTGCGAAASPRPLGLGLLLLLAGLALFWRRARA